MTERNIDTAILHENIQPVFHILINRITSLAVNDIIQKFVIDVFLLITSRQRLEIIIKFLIHDIKLCKNLISTLRVTPNGITRSAKRTNGIILCHHASG